VIYLLLSKCQSLTWDSHFARFGLAPFTILSGWKMLNFTLVWDELLYMIIFFFDNVLYMIINSLIKATKVVVQRI
jgi:hypothetical protein